MKILPFLFAQNKKMYYLCTCNREVTGRSAHKAEGEYTPTCAFLLLKNFNKLLK